MNSLFNRKNSFRININGDIDVEKKRICNLKRAQSYNDAVNFQDCVDTVERYVEKHGILELEKDCSKEECVYNARDHRITNVKPPTDETDAVNFGFLKTFFKNIKKNGYISPQSVSPTEEEKEDDSLLIDEITTMIDEARPSTPLPYSNPIVPSEKMQDKLSKLFFEVVDD